jgi:predicted glycosyltransferase involved in capsule biosynthesis
VGVKNRSSNLLNCLIESLNKASFRPLIDLAVFDCGSTDSPDLHEAIKKRWKGSLSYQRIEQPFSRSVAFNRAVGLSSTDYILICDADMSVPKDIVYKVSKYSSEKAAWFPVCWYENDDGSGRFWTESTGMFACKRENFDKTGGFDETIKTWGKEDWLMYFSFYKQGIGCIRTRERQFVHHYHESLMPSDFKPLF